MDELKKALSEIYPDIDFDNETSLYENGIIDSVDVVTIISKLEEVFEISVTMEYIQPDYFQSAETMWEMVEELM